MLGNEKSFWWELAASFYFLLFSSTRSSFVWFQYVSMCSNRTGRMHTIWYIGTGEISLAGAWRRQAIVLAAEMREDMKEEAWLAQAAPGMRSNIKTSKIIEDRTSTTSKRYRNRTTFTIGLPGIQISCRHVWSRMMRHVHRHIISYHHASIHIDRYLHKIYVHTGVLACLLACLHACLLAS